MVLDNFRTQKIIWDRANKKIFEVIEASSGDSNGRKLVVQVINQETTEGLSGTTLSLGWKSRNGAKGLDAFNIVDDSKGIFEIYYTTEMLSNIGNIEASLILINSTGRIESSTFTISIRPSTVDDESVESENSFTALTEALVKVNDFDTQLAQTVKQGQNEAITKAMLSKEIKEDLNNGEIEFKLNTSEIESGSITGKKIERELTKPYKIQNFIDEDTAIKGGYYHNITGNWIENPDYSSTELIPAAYGDYFTGSDMLGRQVAYWDSNGDYLQRGDINASGVITVPNNLEIAYLRRQIHNDDFENKEMLVKNEPLPTYYVEGGKRILSISSENIENESVEGKHLSSSISLPDNINLLDENSTTQGEYYDRLTGNLVKSPKYRTSDFIECEPGEYLTFSRDPLVGNHITYWDANKKFVVGANYSGVLRNRVPSNDNIKFFRTNISSTSDPNATMIVRGLELPSEYVPYGNRVVKVEKESIPDKLITVDKLSDELVNDYIRPYNKVKNPILTRDDVTDRINVSGVADPFIVQHEGRYHMFFEVVQANNPESETPDVVRDEVAHAYSDDLINWHYTQVVLSYEEKGHRSAYPHVVKIDGEFYMFPDRVGPLIYYKATDFPLEWEFQGELISGFGGYYVDTNLFEIDNVWYVTTTHSTQGGGVSLFYNESGNWKDPDSWSIHPESPIIPNTESEGGIRGAGNPEVFEDYVLLPIQVHPMGGNYGEYTYLYKLGNFSPTSIRATNLGKLTGAKWDGSWEDYSMHHASHAEYINGKKIFAVDGTGTLGYSIGLYISN